MFSSSNSFLGGAGSARPGQQPSFTGQPSPFSQFPQQQQQNGFAPQPTGLSQFPQSGGLAPQPTGFPQSSGLGYGGSQLQPQATGFPSVQLRPQATGFPGTATLQQQPTGLPSAENPPFTMQQLQVPTATGLPSRLAAKTSSEMADSFQDSAPATTSQPSHRSGSKIPNIRLSFITSTDQAKFEQLFKSAVGDKPTMDGA